MTTDQEEMLIIEQVLSARHALSLHQQKIADMKFETRKLENAVIVFEQALIDYLEGNGITKTEHVNLAYTYSANISDVEALPEKYIRLKKEPNKIKINEDYKDSKELPDWLSYDVNKKLTIRGVKNV